MAQNAYKHQSAYNTRMKSQGLCRVTVWVPEDKKDDLLDFAYDIRQKRQRQPVGKSRGAQK